MVCEWVLIWSSLFIDIILLKSGSIIGCKCFLHQTIYVHICICLWTMILSQAQRRFGNAAEEPWKEEDSSDWCSCRILSPIRTGQGSNSLKEASPLVFLSFPCGLCWNSIYIAQWQCSSAEAFSLSAFLRCPELGLGLKFSERFMQMTWDCEIEGVVLFWNLSAFVESYHHRFCRGKHKDPTGKRLQTMMH